MNRALLDFLETFLKDIFSHMTYTNVNYTILFYHLKATVYTEPAAFVVTNKF